MMLKSLDGCEHNFKINITMRREGEFVSMSIGKQLPSKSLWSVIIQAYGCEADTVVNGTELSKLL